jgi:ribosomal protein S18 acetylase RimI-like enzyme
MSYALPEGFTCRRPSQEDIPALLQLYCARDLALYGRVRTNETEVRNNWEMPEHHPQEDDWLLIAPDGSLAGCVFAGHISPISRLHVFLCIHPEHSIPLFYDVLLEMALEHLRTFVPKAEIDVRVSVNAWCGEKDSLMREALTRACFVHVRSNWLMEITMDVPPPEPVWPEGVVLRLYNPAESELLHTIYTVDNEVFQDHWGHMPVPFEMWQMWTNKREGFDPSLWFLAYADAEIAGYALCGYENGEAWVGELGVRRPWRRQGLALALLHQAFGEYYRRGDRRVVLNVDSQNLTGATRLYTRAGMHPFEQNDIYELELRPGRELSTQTLAE